MAIQFEKDLDIKGNKILNQGPPLQRTDGANKAYVDDTLLEFAFPPPTSYATSIGDGTSNVFVIEHNLHSKDIGVTIYSDFTGEEVDVDVTHDTIDTIRLAFGEAPATDEFRVVIYGTVQLTFSPMEGA